MNAAYPSEGSDGSETISLFEGEMVEMELFLPRWQAEALEEAAHGRGVTTGQMVRGLIQEFFGRFAQPCSGDFNRAI